MRCTTSFTYCSIFVLCGLAACQGGIGDDVPGAVDAGYVPDVDANSGTPPFTECLPPDLLVVLDRTGSMAKRPDGTLPENTPDGAKQTKWHAAVTSIQNVTAAFSNQLQFGLALFPRDPDGANGTDCSNLDTWLTEYLPPETNDLSCQPAEVVVAPSMMGHSEIAQVLTTDTVGLCSTTPIGSGLAAAQGALAATATAERQQAVLLITDGDDNCDGKANYSTDSMEIATALEQAGVKVFVVGFDGTGDGIDAYQLNNLACAGGTAPDFANNCMVVGQTRLAVPTPTPAQLFVSATDQQTLEDSLTDIANSICCDCVK